MSGLKDCYDMMDEADEVVQKIDDMCKEGDCDYWRFSLSWPRKALKSMVAAVKAAQPADASFFREWRDVTSDALDHMLEERLAGHAWKEDGPDFKKWSKFDVTLYKAFDELTEVFKKLVETCKPENTARIAANRAAAGLPNNAARDAQKAENRARYNIKAQAEKNLAAAERLATRQAAKNAKLAAEQAAKNAKIAAMTNAERAAAANRAAKAKATRNAKKQAERDAGLALLAANTGRPKRGVTRKNRRN